MKNDLIEIEKINISGVRNPFLTIEGYLKKENLELQLVSNDHKIEFELEKMPSTNRFIIKSVLDPKDHKIELKVELNKDSQIIKIKNTLFIRIKNKIYFTIRRPIITMKVIAITLKRGICYFWREYHFLVPPSLWKKYWKEFKMRIRAKNNTNFLNPLYQSDYLKWLELNEQTPVYEKLSYNPLISVIIPIYNIEPEYLMDCVESILNQHYQNFEI